MDVEAVPYLGDIGSTAFGSYDPLQLLGGPERCPKKRGGGLGGKRIKSFPKPGVAAA